MNDYQQRQIDNQAKRNETLKSMHKGVKESIEALGLKTSFCKYREDSEYNEYQILITDPKNDYFEANLLFNGFEDKKAKLYITDKKQVRRSRGTNSRGEESFQNEKYEYSWIIPNEDLASLDLDMSYSTYNILSLQKMFKADKNIKLILNDILPSLKTYKIVAELAKKHITKRIAKDQEYIDLLNFLQSKTQYPNHVYCSRETANFTYDFGKVEVSSSGNIELTTTISKEDLINKLK